MRGGFRVEEHRSAVRSLEIALKADPIRMQITRREKEQLDLATSNQVERTPMRKCRGSR